MAVVVACVALLMSLGDMSPDPVSQMWLAQAHSLVGTSAGSATRAAVCPRSFSNCTHMCDRISLWHCR